MFGNLHALSYILSQTLSVIASVYLHEPSYIAMKPSDLTDQNDFGFSMAYQDAERANLVVGAPNSNLTGRVYSCYIDDILANRTTCGEIPMNAEKLGNCYRQSHNPQQRFCLGASIAATSDYFLTCAPMCTTDLIKKNGKKIYAAFGACYVYDNSVHRHGSLKAYYNKRSSNTDLLFGGFGWNTLVDETNSLILMSKSAVIGDIAYLNMSRPLSLSDSLVLTNHLGYFNFTNVGYAFESGKFFGDETTIAFSMMNFDMTGVISFLIYNNKARPKLSLLKHKKVVIELTDETVGSMFGTVLCGADIDQDGFTDLFVGAPAQSDDEHSYETGAVHIYLGGDLESINQRKRLRSILGSKDGARFGATLAATDLDGDSHPEIFISAPYEDSGVGAVYVLSGLELNRVLIKTDKFKQIHLDNLMLTQRIQRSEFKTFGYSLKVVPDLDNNGCKELVVGSPGSASAVLFRCVPAANVSITTQLIGAEIVREQDNNFTVRVCVDVNYNLKTKNIISKLQVTNDVIGDGVSIMTPDKDKYDIDLSGRGNTFCEDVIVKLNHNEPGYYKFTARVQLDKDVRESKDFDSNSLTISSYSKTETNLEITRRCSGDDCIPRLSMDIQWTGSISSYEVGSTQNETVTLRVRNDGNSSYEACALINVKGAKVAQLECGDEGDGYKCYLPKPLRRNAEYSINIHLDMSELNNKDERLHVKVLLYKNCNQPDASKLFLDVPYKFSTGDIYLNGASHDRNITDKDILNEDFKTIAEEHEYTVINNGTVTWTDVKAFVMFDDSPFIIPSKATVTGKDDCYKAEDNATFICVFDIEPMSTTKIIVTTEILKNKIMDNLQHGKLNVSTVLLLHVLPTTTIFNEKLTTIMTFQKELKFSQSKLFMLLVSAAVALLVLAIVIFGLYKVDFFKRKEKTKLKELKQEIRRQSVKRSASRSTDPRSSFHQDIDMVIEDETFDTILESHDDVFHEYNNDVKKK